MAKFINSKEYEGVQYYLKANGSKSFYVRYRDEHNILKRVKIGDVANKYFSSKDNSISTHKRLSKYNKHLSEPLGKFSITNIKKDF